MKTKIITTKSIAEFVEVCSLYSDGFIFVDGKYENIGKGHHKNTATYKSHDGMVEIKIQVRV